jgi:5-methylcytosine-specific restriction enzyme subunit McrC
MSDIRLREADQPIAVEMPREVALALIDAQVASIAPTADDGVWSVKSVQRVGAIRVAGYEVHIAPKLPIGRLLHMLSYAKDPTRGWRDDDVQLDHDTDLIDAIAHVYVVALRRSIARGLLQGYRHVSEASNTVRGRIDFAEQIKRHGGLPAPIEVTYDEYTIDVPENQILASAIDRLLRLPRLASATRRRLRHEQTLFAEVSRVPQGMRISRTVLDRRTAHYRGAIDIAHLILNATSLEHRSGTLQATGFLLNVASVFEDFVGAVITGRLQQNFGVVRLQDRSHLDEARRLSIRPDIVWKSRDHALAVMDAKYKAEKPSGYPHADVYQMLAYCTRYGLTDGHLIYAAGETEQLVHEILGADVRIHCHAVDLSGSIGEMHASIQAVADRVAWIAQSPISDTVGSPANGQ